MGERLKLYREGDRSVGICPNCRRKTATRMEYRDFRPDGWPTVVPDVLVACCETCGEVVTVPHQSTAKINRFRPPSPKTADVALRARIPRALEDAMDLAKAALGGGGGLETSTILRFYLDQLARDPRVAEAVRAAAAEPVARKTADRRLEVDVPVADWAVAWEAAREAGITRKEHVLRGVVLLMADDCRIAIEPASHPRATRDDQASRARREALRTLAKVL